MPSLWGTRSIGSRGAEQTVVWGAAGIGQIHAHAPWSSVFLEETECSETQGWCFYKTGFLVLFCCFTSGSTSTRVSWVLGFSEPVSGSHCRKLPEASGTPDRRRGLRRHCCRVALSGTPTGHTLQDSAALAGAPGVGALVPRHPPVHWALLWTDQFAPVSGGFTATRKLLESRLHRKQNGPLLCSHRCWAVCRPCYLCRTHTVREKTAPAVGHAFPSHFPLESVCCGHTRWHGRCGTPSLIRIGRGPVRPDLCPRSPL